MLMNEQVTVKDMEAENLSLAAERVVFVHEGSPARDPSLLPSWFEIRSSLANQDEQRAVGEKHAKSARKGCIYVGSVG